MAVTLYRWDDASAPVLNGTAGSMIAVLDACLVNGYGSKPAAGWTKEFSGTNLAAYRAGGGTQAYLDVVDTSSTQATLRGYMSMTGLSTGGDAFPSGAQGSNYYYKSATGATGRPWVLIADAKRFYIFSASAQTTAEGMQAASNLSSVHGAFFGDIVSYVPGDMYHAALISSNTSGGTGSNFSALDLSLDGALGSHFIARDYTQTGSSLNFSKTAGGRGLSTNMGASGGPYPSPTHGGIDLDPVVVGEPATKVTRGHLPGLWSPAHARPGAPMDTFTGKTGTPLAGKTFLIVPVYSSSAPGHACLEISDTWE